ncbi:MAG: ribose-phosphate pyrophosphokinase [bacterium]|jgi:ribose-phosphate pyrophosphokinase|nr:ribose-phosphate pyrophosphokinase [Candidatus Neomarinimicrobiota bacterium]
MGQYIQKLFSGTSNRELTAKIAEQANLSVGDLVIERFSDGEIWVKYNENLRGNDVYIVQSTNAPGDNIIELALLIDAAKRASAEKINVVIPYFGYSRQDRKDKPRVPISAKVMMDIFTQAGADRIITMDLHSTQIQGFTSIPVDNLYGSLVLMDTLQIYFDNIKNDQKCVVLSPDIGSNKLSQAYAKKLEIGFALIDKRRSEHNQSEVAHLVGNLEDRHVLIIDDMIDTAGTIFNAATVAKEKGALSVTVAATHGVLSGESIKKLSHKNIDKVFLSDTVYIPENKKFEKLTIVSSATIFAETISRVHKGESVSQLFGEVT